MVLLQAGCISHFSTSKRPGNLLRERLLVAELPEEWLMQKKLNIFRVVESGVGGGRLGGLLLVARLTRIDSCFPKG